MSEYSKELELLPISTNFIEEGGYRGRIADRETLDYDAVLREVIDKNFLRMDAQSLKMLLGNVFETMIAGTLKDGKSRRLGEYFTLQMEVRGKFDGPGDQFDSARHKLALAMKPLKAFRRTAGNGDVTVYNRNAGPTVTITSLSSVDGENNPGVVTFGKDLVITGENLWLCDSPQLDPQDGVTVKYYTQFQKAAYMQASMDVASVNAAGTRMVISWERTIAEIIRLNPTILDPAKSQPVAVMIGVRSRGGEATAKQQLHRGKAYFDTWLTAHPDYAGNFKRLRWGGI